MVQPQTGPWKLPIVNLVGTIVLGVAINLATDNKTSWVAWSAVAALGLTIAAMTVVLTRHSEVRGSHRGASIERRSKSRTSFATSGLVMRTTEAKGPDGTSETVVEFFSEEVAIQVFRENFNHDRSS